MTRSLFLIRHTAPDIAPGICYGQLNPGVASGFEQEAQQVREWLPEVNLIISSPLARAHKLAEYLARGCGSELRTDARLLEKHFGAWEGRAWDDIERAELEAWAADVVGHAPPGGESGHQVMLRAQRVLSEAAGLPQENIVMVTPGGVIRAMLAQLGALPLSSTLPWEISYGAVVAVRF